MEPIGFEVSSYGWRHRGRLRWALRDVTFTVEPGERVLIAGPSGVGKTTLLRSIAGIADPAIAAESTGSISHRCAGLEISPAEARRHTGFLMQDPDTNLLMARVGDDIAFGLENACLPRDEIWTRVDDALRQVGFRYGIDRSTTALSGGEKQRVGIAAMLARRPGLMILDEPTANLDPIGARDVIGALREVLAATGITLVLVEHRVTEIVNLVDRIVLLAPGGVHVDADLAEAVENRRNDLIDAGVFLPGRSPAAGIRPWRPAADSPPAISADDVTVARVSRRELALDAVSVTGRAGEATVVVGPNGAGKSTLARVMGGLLKPTRGTATVATSSRPLARMSSRRLARAVGSVFQEPERQFVASSVVSELRVGGRAVGMSRERANALAADLIDRFHLDGLGDANPFTLSGGEKRRLAVAAALVSGPEVLILDEPTFGQDAVTWRALADVLLDQLACGRCMVAVTHDSFLVEVLGAHSVMLDRGRRVA